MEMYSLVVLEDSGEKSVLLSQNQGVSRAVLTLEVLRENIFLVSFSFW